MKIKKVSTCILIMYYFFPKVALPKRKDGLEKVCSTDPALPSLKKEV
jgi:hypothetical protein